MTEGQLLTLWPCHGWEDFPVGMSPSQAESFLACWTALWHPRLILGVRRRPGFWRVDRASECGPEGTVLTVSRIAAERLPPDVLEGIRARGVTLVTGQSRREVLAGLGIEPAASAFGATAAKPAGNPSGADSPPASREWAGHFHALGFAWLQVHLMTRQIRYGGSMDEEAFDAALLRAADAWNAGAADLAIRSELQKCFDLLLEERCRFYPADASLYEAVFGQPLPGELPLAGELESSRPLALVASADEIRKAGQAKPDFTARLRERLAAGRLSLVSGGLFELDGIRAHVSSVRRNLQAGQAVWQELLGAGAEVLGGRQTGFSFSDPGLALEAGFELALHCSFGSHPTPDFSAPTVLWQSPDGQLLPTLARQPLDASRADCLLRLGSEIGELVDSWHAAHIVLAHWPGQFTESWNDLLQTMEYGHLLGRFRLLGKAAERLNAQTYGETLDADAWDRRPSFPGRDAALVCSQRLREYWRWMPELLSLRRTAVLVDGVLVDSSAWLADAGRLVQEMDRLLDGNPVSAPAADSIPTGMENLRQRLVELLQAGWKQARPADRGSPPVTGRVLAIHSSARPRTAFLSWPESDAGNGPRPREVRVVREAAADDRAPVRIVQQGGGSSDWVVALPATAAVILAPATGEGKRTASRRAVGPMIAGHRLVNEFLSVEINRGSGSIAAIRIPGERKSLVSQRLGIRLAAPAAGGRSPSSDGQSPRPDAMYAEMVADSFRFSGGGEAVAVCESEGRLVDGSRVLAEYSQRIRVERCCRTVELEIGYRLHEKLSGSLWREHFCSRLAWQDGMEPRFRWLQESRQRCCLERFSAPQCLEIGAGDHRIALFTHGNVWQRQSALNILDTILAEKPEGESGPVRFRLAIGIDIPHTLEEACHQASQPLLVPGVPESVQDFRLAGWSDSTLHWYDGEVTREVTSGQRVKTFHFRETAGKSGTATVRFPVPPVGAELRDGSGKRIGPAEVVGPAVSFAYQRGQLVSLAVFWTT